MKTRIVFEERRSGVVEVEDGLLDSGCLNTVLPAQLPDNVRWLGDATRTVIYAEHVLPDEDVVLDEELPEIDNVQ